MKNDEGYIKYNLNWNKTPFEFSDKNFQALNNYRQKLFDRGLIGAYSNGIGFGNLSIRYHNLEFIISGSATGNFKTLTKNHFALVNKFDVETNQVSCEGFIEASSESLSHGAIYKVNNQTNAVIHIHHFAMWEKYKNDLPTTPPKAAFGTPEIAFEIANRANQDSGIIIMGGHPEGIITYGKTLEIAYQIILKYYNQI